MDVVNRQPNTAELLDYFAVDVFVALVLRLMIAVTSTKGIHQHCSVKNVFISLMADCK